MEMSSARSIVRRALLYGTTSDISLFFSLPRSHVPTVPGSSQRMLDKSRGLTVDCVTYDLEDSVTPSKKMEARIAISKLLGQPRSSGVREIAVRINAVESGLALDDLSEVVSSRRLRLMC